MKKYSSLKDALSDSKIDEAIKPIDIKPFGVIHYMGRNGVLRQMEKIMSNGGRGLGTQITYMKKIPVKSEYNNLYFGVMVQFIGRFISIRNTETYARIIESYIRIMNSDSKEMVDDKRGNQKLVRKLTPRAKKCKAALEEYNEAYGDWDKQCDIIESYMKEYHPEIVNKHLINNSANIFFAKDDDGNECIKVTTTGTDRHAPKQDIYCLVGGYEMTLPEDMFVNAFGYALEDGYQDILRGIDKLYHEKENTISNVTYNLIPVNDIIDIKYDGPKLSIARGESDRKRMEDEIVDDAMDDYDSMRDTIIAMNEFLIQNDIESKEWDKIMSDKDSIVGDRPDQLVRDFEKIERIFNRIIRTASREDGCDYIHAWNKF